jgi:hypothetical protein
VEKLKAANDVRRFPGRQQEGYESRRQALSPVLQQLESEGPAVIPYLLPMAYSFSWASLFIPDLLYAFGDDSSIQLLCELSMFRFPYFSQKCCTYLEDLGERAIPHIENVLQENSAFDELKVGLILVLGNIPTTESFAMLTGLVDHENSIVVKGAAQALDQMNHPEGEPFLKKAQERLESQSTMAGVINQLANPKI